MAKAVLISIRPEWVGKILSGEKTLEVRKTRPKLETPFKVYIYCTSGRPDLNIPISPERLMRDYLDTGSMRSLNCPLGNGKVIGEFVCDKIDVIWRMGIPANFDYCHLSLNEWGNDDIETEIRDIMGSCIPKERLNSYAGKAPVLYAWHISDLKIYGKPKQLSEFTRLEIKRFWVSERLPICPEIIRFALRMNTTVQITFLSDILTGTFGAEGGRISPTGCRSRNRRRKEETKMRLIDADELRRRIIAFSTGSNTTYLTVENIVIMINKADTVDAVPVVRCKDCVSFEQKGKYPAGMPEYPDEMPYGYCYHWDYEQGMSPNQVDGNDFCSYGQRRGQSADVRNTEGENKYE